MCNVKYFKIFYRYNIIHYNIVIHFLRIFIHFLLGGHSTTNCGIHLYLRTREDLTSIPELSIETTFELEPATIRATPGRTFGRFNLPTAQEKTTKSFE